MRSPTKLVHDFLLESAQRTPGKTALVCGRERLTFRDLEAQSASLARALRAAGLERGDRVLIWQENSIQTVVAIFAALWAGGVFVVIDPAVKARKLAFLLADSEARALIAPGVKMSELGRPAILELALGRGCVVAFNFSPVHRDMNRSDHRLLWNAILNWSALK